MINVEKIKQAALKGIALKPTSITLERLNKKSNGMRGEVFEKVIIGKYDVFIDDSRRNVNFNVEDSGQLITVRSLKMIIVIELLKTGDYFILDNSKYRVTYPGELVKGVYEADIKKVGEGNE